MSRYNFLIGTKNTRVEFAITDDENLLVTVKKDGEEYNLTFFDGIFLDRKYNDCNLYKTYNFSGAFSKNSKVQSEDNIIEFTTNPTDRNTGEIVKSLSVVNRFILSDKDESIRQETFFLQEGVRYDCSFYIGRVKADIESFEMICGNNERIAFELEEIKNNNLSFQKEMVLRGNSRYLKIIGGHVSYEKNGLIDAHADSTLYNDSPAYFNEKNPIITIYSFEEYNSEITEDHHKTMSTPPSLLKNTVALKSGSLCAGLAWSNNQLAIIDKGEEFSLVAMLLRDVTSGEEVFADTLSKWERVIVEQDNLKTFFRLENPCEGKIKKIALNITAQKVVEKNRLEWTVEVENNSDRYSLLWCTYPRLFVSKNAVCDMFVPSYGGTVEQNFNETDNYTGGAYPSGFWYTMPYYALYNAKEEKKNGVYFAIHDNSGALKDLNTSSDKNGRVRFNSRFFAEDFGIAGNSNRLPGKAVWQIFDGDWYDATNIYREFVRAECDWCSDDVCKNTPQWMKEIPFWIMDWVPYDPDSGQILPTNLRQDSDVINYNDWYENPIKLQEELKTPIGYHVYNWHQIPFNNDYPHFMPAKKSFVEGLKKLKEKDIRIMPYINALLWDTKDRGCENYMFESVGRKGAVKKENGDVEILTYESRESNGEPVKLAPMCPSSREWKDTLIKLTSDIFCKYDVDAIYLDQIAARVPHLCMDEAHSHPRGGGSWWIEEYNKLLTELNSTKGKDKAFTTESNAEVYTKNIDGFLSWSWIRTEKDVPAFMRIYGDKVCVLGRNTNGYIKLNDMHWKYHLAQEFVCGQQMGWVNADVVKNKKRLELVKKLVRFRYEYKELFKKAIVMRPPEIKKTENNCFISRVGMNYPKLLQRPYLCSGTLDCRECKMMLIVNIRDKAVRDILKWKEEEYLFNCDNYKVIGNASVKIIDGGSLEINVEKESFACIMWQ